MNDKPEYVYIMYPVPIEKVKDLQIPFNINERNPYIPLESNETFMPLWYGNAKFPEDDIC